jgi:hypothetical protein
MPTAFFGAFKGFEFKPMALFWAFKGSDAYGFFFWTQGVLLLILAHLWVTSTTPLLHRQILAIFTPFLRAHFTPFFLHSLYTPSLSFYGNQGKNKRII